MQKLKVGREEHNPRYSPEIIKYHIVTLIKMGVPTGEIDRQTGLDSQRVLSDEMYFHRNRFDVYRIVRMLHETDYHKEREILDTVKIVRFPSAYNAYLLNSSCIQDMFEKVCEFCSLCYPDNSFEWFESDKSVYFYFNQNERELEFSTPQGFLIYVVRMIYEYCNDEEIDIEVGTTSFGFPDYERFVVYATGNINFGAERSYVKVTRNAAFENNPAYNPKVASFLKSQFVSRFPEPVNVQGLETLVVRDIGEAMEEGGDSRIFNVDFMSKRHGMSRSTLYRRLQQSGTNFNDIADRLRKEKAKELLSNPLVTISEVSQRLGYSSTSAFGRAFLRWFEVPPTAYRDS